MLEELADQHELPRVIVEYREIDKLKGTYIDALPRVVDPDDGAHPHDLRPGRRRDRAPLVARPEPAEHPDPHRRSAARSGARSSRPPGTSSCAADYSQVELRVLAHLSRDEKLVEAFRTGEDVHVRTAVARSST